MAACSLDNQACAPTESLYDSYFSWEQPQRGKVDVVLGTQFGGEGKGKVSTYYSKNYDYGLVVKTDGGGTTQTVVSDGKIYRFRSVPLAIVQGNVQCMIGPGAAIHLKSLFEELGQLKKNHVDYKDRLFISSNAHLVFDFDKEIDHFLAHSEQGNFLASCRVYVSKALRNGLRAGDIRDMQYFETRLRQLAQDVERMYPGVKVNVEKELAFFQDHATEIKSLLIDSVSCIDETLSRGEHVLVEGAHGTMVNPDSRFYPFVKNAPSSIGSVLFSGLGVSPKELGKVTGVVKAYITRDDGAIFLTEINDREVRNQILVKGDEFVEDDGTPKRVGWIDMKELLLADKLNGFDRYHLTKLDVLSGQDVIKIGKHYKYKECSETLTGVIRCIYYYFPDLRMPLHMKHCVDTDVEYETMPGWKEDISKCRQFEKLPANCRRFVLRLEELLGKPISHISVGPGESDVIVR